MLGVPAIIVVFLILRIWVRALQPRVWFTHTKKDATRGAGSSGNVIKKGTQGAVAKEKHPLVTSGGC